MPVKTESITSKPAPAVHTVLSSGTTAVAKYPSSNSSSNTLGVGDYKASIYFKDGEKRDGTILSTSTNNIYEIRFTGEKNVKQYNVNSIARIERKGVSVTPQNTVPTVASSSSNFSAVSTVGVDYKASILFKDGSRRDGTILSTSTNNIYEIRFAGEKNIKQYNVNSIARIERKGEGVTPQNTAPTVASSSSNFSSMSTVGADYKASILFKDGSRRDGTILSTSTNNIYEIRFAGEKNIKQYNANTIERIEPKGSSSSSVAPIVIPAAIPFSQTTKKVATSKKQSQVPDWKPYKALVYLKNGAKIDGTVVSEGVESVKIKIAGGSVIEAKSDEISKIDRT